MTEGLALARIKPLQRAVARRQEGLSSPQKAAVVVRYMLEQGTSLPLTTLPEPLQAILAEAMAEMRLIDRDTLDQVMAEFLAALDGIGLAFTGGLEGALTAMDGHLSQNTASRLRRRIGAGSQGDPWERLLHHPAEPLARLLEQEAAEVAAVALSKLPVARAAEILTRLPGEKARRIAFAVSQTGQVDPETVQRIGAALLAQIHAQPQQAFEATAGARMGAILNVSPSATRDAVLQGLEAEDADFAQEVRQAIFTFAHIPTRVSGRDIPKLLRLIDQPTLAKALAAAQAHPAEANTRDFILACIPQRMAQMLRDELEALAAQRPEEGEAAQNAVVSALRLLEARGELVMLPPAQAAHPVDGNPRGNVDLTDVNTAK